MATKISTPVRAPRKQYIVTFDIDDSDPVEVFDSLDAAKNYISAIMKGDDNHPRIQASNYTAEVIDKASIKVYEGILIGKPKIEVTFIR